MREFLLTNNDDLEVTDDVGRQRNLGEGLPLIEEILFVE
jgi:hypothetical protein